MSKVPSGTKGPGGRPPLADGHPFFCRPARDFYLCWTLNPAMNGWAIVIASLRDRPQVWFCSARPSSGLRPPSPAPAGEGHVGGEGEIVRRLFEKPAPGLAGPSSAKPESSTGHSLAPDRKSTRLNSSHLGISYAVF